MSLFAKNAHIFAKISRKIRTFARKLKTIEDGKEEDIIHQPRNCSLRS